VPSVVTMVLRGFQWLPESAWLDASGTVKIMTGPPSTVERTRAPGGVRK
jgi:hypothetical protein